MRPVMGAEEAAARFWLLESIPMSIMSSSIKSFSGEFIAELSEHPERDDIELMDMFFLRVLADFSMRVSISGRLFLGGLPRLTTLRTTPSKVPMHMPR